MKVIIPVAGAGKRLRPFTYTQPKPLIPLAGKPIVSHLIRQLKDAGFNDFVFVIGYLGESLRDHIDTSHPDINREYVYQEQREGLGHAIWSARDVLKEEEEILIVLGDVIFEADLESFKSCDSSCIAVARVEDPREFGIVEEDANGYATRVVEKPRIPKSNLAIVGIYKIREVDLLLKILDQIVEEDQRTWDEIQLTDALMIMIDKGIKIKTLPVLNWFDCGKTEVLLMTNQLLLDKSELPDHSKHKTDNIIIPPVFIGPDCDIHHSIIGPNVTIAEGTKVSNSIVTNSVIGKFANLKEVILSDSIIGNDAGIRGSRQKLNLGDHTQIDQSANN